MATCEPRILINGSHMNVVQCKHCNRIGLYYKNVLIGYSFKEFFSFSNVVTQMDFEQNSVFFTDNQKHLILSTCHQDIQLTFLREEFEELVDALNQARLIIEAEYYASKK